ncbi:Gfo/Idh/MocA family oxidoreductase [Bacillus sp. NEB1478]|uniref:Gfo/Idh/MocA family protein n=1 Tax=Bacillus sp. NEB1478 TaxID=3073816 RepID=UPI002872F454|nr:Gfo/Idh/MocA family oxidoreductase [Bacillus sp. NEB1478]WNB91044.1 Gfo/Idh/MocA family oxidoreductase [Bacillus sp. NEB1478]
MKIGIIGLGAIGQRLLKMFNEHPEVEIVAICDANESVLQATKEQLPNAEAYTDYQNLIASDEVELVYIAVPPKYHHQIALDTAKKGKHILCEKPLANSLEEADEMREAVHGKNLINAMNFPIFYRSEFHHIDTLIKEKYIGELLRVEVKVHFHEWPRPWQQNPWIAGREQGGFVREVVPHYLQMVQRFFGPITSVDTFMEYPEDPALCETSVIARLQLANGVPVLLDGLSQTAEKEEVLLKIYGTEGTIALRNWTVLEMAGKGEDLSAVEADTTEEPLNLVDELIKALNGEDAKLIDFEEGYEIQKVLEKILVK